MTSTPGSTSTTRFEPPFPPSIAREIVEDQVAAVRPANVFVLVGCFGASALLAVYLYVRLLEWSLGLTPTLVAALVLVVPFAQHGLFRGRLWAYALALQAMAVVAGISGYWFWSMVRANPDWTSALLAGLWDLAAMVLSGAAVRILLSPSCRRWFLQAHALRRRRFIGIEDIANMIKAQRSRGRLLVLLVLLGASTAWGDEPVFTATRIFPPERKHNHASCIVELPGGDLFVAWYRGTGERSADDVEIWAARKKKGDTAWGERFLLADTPGYPDCNPALFAAPNGTLWLWRPVILDHRWEGALLKFSVATAYPDANRPPKWDREGVLHVTPERFEQAMEAAIAGLDESARNLGEPFFQRARDRAKDLLYQRLGWMPRVHPIVLPSGRWLLPLYCDTFSASIVMRSDDQGATWQPSTPIIGWGAIQPALVRKNDGTIVAFMRDNGPFKQIRTCSSKDEGATWGPVTSTGLPNPGAGVDAIRLRSGKWALIYNDTKRGRHSLALSLSDDEGATWKSTRHVQLDPEQRQSFHYPSILQAADGLIHVTYTHGGQPDGSSIDHAQFNEAWVLQGDPEKPAP